MEHENKRGTERHFVMIDDTGTLKPLINSLEEVALFDSEEHATAHAKWYCNGRERVTFQVFKSAT